MQLLKSTKISKSKETQWERWPGSLSSGWQRVYLRRSSLEWMPGPSTLKSGTCIEKEKPAVRASTAIAQVFVEALPPHESTAHAATVADCTCARTLLRSHEDDVAGGCTSHNLNSSLSSARRSYIPFKLAE